MAIELGFYPAHLLYGMAQYQSYIDVIKLNDMNTVDDVIKALLENLEYAYKLKYEGENENQDLGSLLDSLSDQFR
jgi:hypothetical protein